METLVTRAAMSATADSVATTATMAALESEGMSNDSYGEWSEDDGDKVTKSYRHFVVCLVLRT